MVTSTVFVVDGSVALSWCVTRSFCEAGQHHARKSYVERTEKNRKNISGWKNKNVIMCECGSYEYEYGNMGSYDYDISCDAAGLILFTAGALLTACRLMKLRTHDLFVVLLMDTCNTAAELMTLLLITITGVLTPISHCYLKVHEV